jgi:hypothetical protein
MVKSAMTADWWIMCKRPKLKVFEYVSSITAIGILFFFALGPFPGIALVGESDGSFGLDGSFRTFAGLSHNYDFSPYFGEDNQTGTKLQSILRLTAGGNLFKNMSYEIHPVQTLSYLSANQGNEAGALGSVIHSKKRYRALDETWDWINEKRTMASLFVDRFNLKLSLEAMDITIGRQAVTFGKAYFWNPMDVFLPFDPAQLDRDYKPGVDALRFDIPTGDFSGFTLIGVLGRKIDLSGVYEHDEKKWDTSWYGSGVLGRFFTNLSGWDMAFQFGKIYGGYQFGGGMVGEIKGIGIRGEAAYFCADRSPPAPPPLSGDLYEDHFTGVVGFGRRFQNSLNIEFEYLYNGGGESNNPYTTLYRLQCGAIMHMGRHLSGLLFSYEFTPIVVGQLAGIYAFCDSSAQVQPTLTLSLGDNTDLIIGAGINVGQRPSIDPFQNIEIKSEFGTYPNLYFAEFKIYF